MRDGKGDVSRVQAQEGRTSREPGGARVLWGAQLSTGNARGPCRGPYELPRRHLPHTTTGPNIVAQPGPAALMISGLTPATTTSELRRTRSIMCRSWGARSMPGTPR